jgi:hypothetical protein
MLTERLRGFEWEKGKDYNPRESICKLILLIFVLFFAREAGAVSVTASVDCLVMALKGKLFGFYFSGSLFS